MERDAWTDDKQLLDWHRICFQETEQLETKADVLRRKLAYLFVASSFKNTNGLPLHHSMELKRLHKKFVECMDNKNGINNFAESVQSLVSGRPSESGEWKSGLSKDSLQRFTTLKGKKQQLDFSTLRLEKKQPTELLGQKPPEMLQPLPSSKVPATPFVPTPVLPSSSTQNSFRVPSSHQQPVHCGMPSSVCTSVPRETVSSGQPSTQVPLYATRAHHQTFNDETQWQMRPSVQNTRVTTYGGDRQEKGKGFKYANKYSKRKRQRGGSLEDDEDDDCIAEDSAQKKSNAFITARDQFHINQNQKNSGPGGGGTTGHGPSGGCYNNYDQSSVGNYGVSKRSLGARRGPAGKFVPPVKRDQEDEAHDEIRSRVLYGGPSNSSKNLPPELEGDERLKNIEPKMVELITNEIMDHGSPVQWEDIAGLDFAKSSIKEIVVWPMLRPDIFTGLRGPPRGLLLFGPPGTGKTLIGKCVASQVKATFFSISASSLTSKWVGEGEKMVRALFAVARCYQPAVIFIDEIDSLLSQRSDNEHEASRRIKTEFLVQLDGATTSSEDHILVIGATNRPQEIDEAARRRLVKRLYIPLPDMSARKQIILNLLKEQKHSLDTSDLDKLCTETDGYSGADMANLCRDAAYWPLRSITDIANISAEQVRPITFDDFTKSLATIRPSVSSKDLDIYIEWNKTYGSGK